MMHYSERPSSRPLNPRLLKINKNPPVGTLTDAGYLSNDSQSSDHSRDSPPFFSHQSNGGSNTTQNMDLSARHVAALFIAVVAILVTVRYFVKEPYPIQDMNSIQLTNSEEAKSSMEMYVLLRETSTQLKQEVEARVRAEFMSLILFLLLVILSIKVFCPDFEKIVKKILV